MHLRRAALALGFVTTAALVLSLAAGATIPVVKIATDPFTNSTSQHKTLVETDPHSSATDDRPARLVLVRLHDRLRGAVRALLRRRRVRHRLRYVDQQRLDMD